MRNRFGKSFQRPRRHMHVVCAAGLLMVSTPVLIRAEEIRGQLLDHLPERAWLENYDPTLVSSRFFSEFTYESHDNDADFYKIENTLRWGIPLGDGLALGFQAMVPVKWNETATSDDSGFGDIEVRTALVGRLSSTVRYAFGLNAQFESASDPALGSSAFILRPITAVRWDATTRLNLGLNIEYNFTPLEENADDMSALELKFPLAFKLSDDWSAALTYKPRWNLLTDENRHRLELGAARLWGTDNQYALSFGIEMPLTSEDFQCKLITAFAWHF